jgi:hypothetical protein
MLITGGPKYSGMGPYEVASLSRANLRYMECRMSVDILLRLRNFNSKTPFAKDMALEAADEIERLRRAIGRHKQEVWGADEPQHASDIALYRALSTSSNETRSKT